jgi:hypothetical protein
MVLAAPFNPRHNTAQACKWHTHNVSGQQLGHCLCFPCHELDSTLHGLFHARQWATTTTLAKAAQRMQRCSWRQTCFHTSQWHMGLVLVGSVPPATAVRPITFGPFDSVPNAGFGPGGPGGATAWPPQLLLWTFTGAPAPAVEVLCPQVLNDLFSVPLRLPVLNMPAALCWCSVPLLHGTGFCQYAIAACLYLCRWYQSFPCRMDCIICKISVDHIGQIGR